MVRVLMAGRYAQNTNVSSQDSLAEIERTVTRYGASAFSYGWDQTTATATVGSASGVGGNGDGSARRA